MFDLELGERSNSGIEGSEGIARRARHRFIDLLRR
jgi:hypothetical protein